MGVFRSRKRMAAEIEASMRASAIQGLPLQKRILTALGHDLVEWRHDGCLVRARPAGEIFGADADPLLVGTARFIRETDGTDLYEYPTRVLAEGGRLVSSGRALSDVLAEILDVAEWKSPIDETAQSGTVTRDGSTSSPAAPTTPRPDEPVAISPNVAALVEMSVGDQAAKFFAEQGMVWPDRASIRAAREGPLAGIVTHFDRDEIQAQFTELLRRTFAPDRLEADGDTLLWSNGVTTQRISLSGPFDRDGQPFVAVRVESLAAAEVLPDHPLIGFLDGLNQQASLPALVYDPVHRAVVATAALLSSPHPTGDTATEVLHVAAMQAHEVASRQPLLARIAGVDAIVGDNAVSGHVVDLRQQLKAAAARGVATCGALFDRLRADPPFGVLDVRGDDTVLAAVVWCRPDRSDTLLPATNSPSRGGRVARVQVRADIQHPAYGPGLFAVLEFPSDFGAPDVADTAHRLNQAERAEAPPFTSLGAWCAAPTGGALAHVQFWPAALITDKVPASILATAAWRAAWAGTPLD